MTLVLPETKAPKAQEALLGLKDRKEWPVRWGLRVPRVLRGIKASAVLRVLRDQQAQTQPCQVQRVPRGHEVRRATPELTPPSPAQKVPRDLRDPRGRLVHRDRKEPTLQFRDRRGLRVTQVPREIQDPRVLRAQTVQPALRATPESKDPRVSRVPRGLKGSKGSKENAGYRASPDRRVIPGRKVR